MTHEEVGYYRAGTILSCASDSPAGGFIGQVLIGGEGYNRWHEAATPPDVLRRAVETAVAGEDEVIAAYLFGSSAHGAAGPLSDVDVAVLTNGLPADDDAIVDRLADRLERTLRVPRVDVVALSRAALPLRYRVRRDGALIVSRDAARLERFIVESTLHYLDFAPLREHAFCIQRAAILAHGR
jgi:hypothetical protein